MQLVMMTVLPALTSTTRPTPQTRRISPVTATGVVLGLAGALLVCGLLDHARFSPTFTLSFIAPASLLSLWGAALCWLAPRTGRTLNVVVSVRPQHYIQALTQVVFLLYWGWFWRPVYDMVWLITAQLIFAYAFELLFCWSRQHTYHLGFGPFPVIFSINLFLWFERDWFYLQFLLVALGFAVKALIRWEHHGRLVHIFTPSSFPLAVFSLALILTGTSDLTWGQDIATTQFYPPHVYLVLFLIGLPGQLLFGVTSMTMSAVVVTYLCGLLYYGITGVYFFYDSYIPIAVFLGMHLLFTDPSTAPRTELGRICFGALYGLSTMVLYALLLRAGVPPFYDKLLQVPLLNLSIRLLDRLAAVKWLRTITPVSSSSALRPRQRHLAYVMAWLLVFSVLSATHSVGDHHPGQFIPFWQQACRAERPHACAYLTNTQLRLCRAGSGWACNEAGIRQTSSSRLAQPSSDFNGAGGLFDRGCALGFTPACQNQAPLARSQETRRVPTSGPPTLDDYPILLRGTKRPITTQAPDVLFALACRQGWPDTCGTGTRPAPN